MLQNTSKTLGCKKIMVYKTAPGEGGKPHLAHGLIILHVQTCCTRNAYSVKRRNAFCSKIIAICVILSKEENSLSRHSQNSKPVLQDGSRSFVLILKRNPRMLFEE